MRFQFPSRLPALLRALPLVLALGACSTDEPLYDVNIIPPGPPPYPLAEGPEMTLELSRNTAEARPFIEELGARCWLDGVLSAANMVVDRQSGRIVFAGESEDLLVVDFLPTAEPAALARMRLSGPTIGDDEKTTELLSHLTKAERTGEIDCPPLET
ncbi:MAG: hypothetical protein AAF074_05445 [Pseudomonadota bacterium]